MSTTARFVRGAFYGGIISALLWCVIIVAFMGEL